MRTEEEKAHSRLRTEMHATFESEEIFNASEETMQKYLASLCTERVPNEEVRHREIIKALTINHIQMYRHIDKLNKKNSFLQAIVIILTIAVLVAATIQSYVSIECSRQYSQLAQSQSTQQAPQSKLISIPKKQGGATMEDLPISYQSPIKDETKQKPK